MIAFEEASLDFDTVNTGESKDLVANVKNIGDTTLDITNIWFDDSDSSVFWISNMPSTFSLEPNSKTSFTVRFTPQLRAEYKGIVKFESNAQNAPSKAFDLRGFGYQDAPLITTTTNELNFPTIWIDSVRVLHFTMQNIGELPLNVTDLRIENDTFDVFTCLNLNKQYVILPGEGRDVTVAFSPNELRDYSAELSIISNAYNGQSYTVKLSGKCDGPAPEIKLASTSIFFLKTNVGNTRERNFEISNIGNSELIISNVYVENDTAGIFPLPDLNLPIIIKPDSTDTIKIVFTPKEAITYRMNLIIQSNSFYNSSDTVPLRGPGGTPTEVNESYVANDEMTICVKPNPVLDESIIEIEIFDDNNLPVELSLFDMMGRKLYTITNTKYLKGKYEFAINTTSINSGTYYLSSVRGDLRLNLLAIVIK